MARAASRPSFRPLARSILQASWDFDPTRGVFLGLHRYDGQLPVLTKATIDRRVEVVRRQLKALDAVIVALLLVLQREARRRLR